MTSKVAIINGQMTIIAAGGRQAGSVVWPDTSGLEIETAFSFMYSSPFLDRRVSYVSAWPEGTPVGRIPTTAW